MSESRKRKKNNLLGKNYTNHRTVKVNHNTKLVEVSREGRKMRDNLYEAVPKEDRSYSFFIYMKISEMEVKYLHLN